MKTVAVLYAEGFEDIEGIAITDVLRRAEFDVTTVGVTGDTITSAHGVTITPDTTLDQIAAESLGALILPGGQPGADNLRDNEQVIELVKAVAAAGKPVGAICAAPIILEKAGLLAGKQFTCYPGYEEQCASGTHTGSRTQVDGDIITGKGPGAAIEFALELVAHFGKAGAASQLREGMIVLT